MRISRETVSRNAPKYADRIALGVRLQRCTLSDDNIHAYNIHAFLLLLNIILDKF